jgi:hypothetical protein
MTSEFGPSVQDDGLFGRWENMQAWFKEADAIMEKPLPTSVAETISFPGDWSVMVEIPTRQKWGDAMEAGLELLAEVGVRADEAYLEPSYLGIELNARKSPEAAFLAEQIRKWLVANGYEVLGQEIPWSPHAPACLRLVKRDSYDPTAGDWSLTVMIPEECGGIDAGRNLAGHLGMTAKEPYLLGGGWSFEFEIGEFANAKRKTKEAISWLRKRNREIETSWGDVGLCLDSLSEEALRSLNEFHDRRPYPVRVAGPFVLLVDEKGNRVPEWRSLLNRIVARTGGSADQLPIVIRSCEARVLLDLAGEHFLDYKRVLGEWQLAQAGYHVSRFCRQHTEDLETATTILREIIGNLRVALDGEQTSDSRETRLPF